MVEVLTGYDPAEDAQLDASIAPIVDVLRASRLTATPPLAQPSQSVPGDLSRLVAPPARVG